MLRSTTTFGNAGKLLLVGMVLLSHDAGGQAPAATRSATTALTPAGVARIDSAMKAYVASGKFPGIVVAVARDGQVALWQAYGVRTITPKDPMDRNDLFRIYSMTKPITSTGVMMLVDEGKVGLDDPVAKYLPELGAVKVWSREGPVAAKRAITVRDLLRHTSGFTYGLFGETPVDSLYRNAGLMNPGLTLPQLMTKLARLPLIGQPGEIWNYGFSTDVAGRLIEVVSGQPLDRFFAERIFVPLKMPDTFFQVPAGKRSRLTGYYGINPAGTVLLDSPDTGSATKPPPMFSGGGGLVSTASDYLRFAQMILNGGELDGVRLLKRETVAEMLKNQLPQSLIPIRVGPYPLPNTGFGLGFSIAVGSTTEGVNDEGRAGWGGYANTFFWIDPGRRLIGMVMAQTFPFNQHPLEPDFRKLVYAALK